MVADHFVQEYNVTVIFTIANPEVVATNKSAIGVIEKLLSKADVERALIYPCEFRPGEIDHHLTG